MAEGTGVWGCVLPIARVLLVEQEEQMACALGQGSGGGKSPTPHAVPSPANPAAGKRVRGGPVGT